MALLSVGLAVLANVVAARIGPTVCDDDGPMPTLNKSTILMVIIFILIALFNKQNQFRAGNDFKNSDSELKFELNVNWIL